MENSFFLPKGTEGRKKNIMVLHIQGLILIVVLIIMLSSSLGIIGRTVLSEVVYRSGILDPGAEQELTELMQSGNMYALMTYTYEPSPAVKLFQNAMKVWSVLGYIVTFASLAGAIYWLGFLLGAYGGHLFAMKKKKAWIYLGLGILGIWIPIFFFYTSGISFADAFLACFIEKDAYGFIEMEDYPHWL